MFFARKTSELPGSDSSHRRWSRGFDGRHPSPLPFLSIKSFGPSSSTPVRDAALLADVGSSRVEHTRPSVAVKRPTPFPNIPFFALTTFRVVQQVPVRTNFVMLRKPIPISQNSPCHYAQSSKRMPWTAIGPVITS